MKFFLHNKYYATIQEYQSYSGWGVQWPGMNSWVPRKGAITTESQRTISRKAAKHDRKETSGITQRRKARKEELKNRLLPFLNPMDSRKGNGSHWP